MYRRLYFSFYFPMKEGLFDLRWVSVKFFFFLNPDLERQKIGVAVIIFAWNYTQTVLFIRIIQIKTNLNAFCSSTLLQLFQWGKEKSKKRNVQWKTIKSVTNSLCLLFIIHLFYLCREKAPSD
ncbi:hypothetical protein BpHYR1_006385 [Brachionus plicatilis]|uniref:Uncharacterized protein n=1 Tax=Brachionus plicatilis TaxID=10195 RepID=A0A3M7R7C4_BRAPC|nr:hypothetical protein BpHYR1_006385 [Brachionus plicatilis]